MMTAVALGEDPQAGCVPADRRAGCSREGRFFTHDDVTQHRTAEGRVPEGCVWQEDIRASEHRSSPPEQAERHGHEEGGRESFDPDNGQAPLKGYCRIVSS